MSPCDPRRELSVPTLVRKRAQRGWLETFNGLFWREPNAASAQVSSQPPGISNLAWPKWQAKVEPTPGALSIRNCA